MSFLGGYLRPCRSSTRPFANLTPLPTLSPHYHSHSSIIPTPARSLRSFPSNYSAVSHTSRTSPAGRPLSISESVSRGPQVTLGARRHFTLFNRQPTPTALQLLHISRLEADANAHPADLEKITTFWKELLPYPLGQKRVISLYERMVEFNPASPTTRASELFELYIKALVASGQAASVDAAVRSRDALLTRPVEEPAPEKIENLSPSAQIARDIMASSTKKTSDSWLNNLRSRVTGPSALGAAAATPDGSSGAGVRGNPVHVVVEQSRGNVLLSTVRFLFITALVTYGVITVLALFMEGAGLGRNPGKQRNMEFEPAAGQKIYKFSDVHGVDEAKDDLMEVVEFLRDPSRFSALGGRLPKGVLLTGPPGTGKTLLARAVAGEAGVPFLYASGSEFDEMYVGVGAKRIRELFALARKKQPAIIFIDEIDAIGARRGGRDQHYIKQTLNQLLVELDGFSPSDGIIVIAATNFPELLDKALVRPGRFDKSVAVPLPDIRGRTQILRHHMSNVLTGVDVDTNVLARGTPGFSGAELENLVNQAAVFAARKGDTSISMKDFEWAKDKILMGTERLSAYIPEKVKRATALHEGGHTLVALFTPGAMPLHKVTCIPRGHALGLTQMLPKDDRHSISWREFIAQIDVSLGGRMAEELVNGKENITSGASSDLHNASAVANRMVQQWGFSDKLGLAYFDTKDNTMSTAKREAIESEVDRMLRESQERVRQLLTERMDELHLLTEALVEYETLDEQEVLKVIKGQRIRQGEPKRPRPTGSLGIREPDPHGDMGSPLPPTGGPLPHPAPHGNSTRERTL